MSDLPRVLLCSFDVIPGPTGSSRRFTEYLRGLSERFSVVVLSVKTPDHPHIQRYQGARLLRVPVGGGDLPSRALAFDRAVRRQLESEEYALVHFTDPFGGLPVCELRESYGHRLIYEALRFPSQELASVHPQVESDRKFLARVRRQELFCLMSADRVITGSDVTRTHVRSLGVSEDQVEVLRVPVNPEAFLTQASGESAGVPLHVAYLGSQVDWQGLPTLLHAARRAREQIELRLTLIGPPHEREQPRLEGLIRELGLEQTVTLAGPIPHEELPSLLASADICVAPLMDVERNRVQGGPLAKLAEYLAAGRPILASDLPLTRELVPADAGLFHPAGDVESLASDLVCLARSAELRARMGAAAREAARRMHDGAVISRRLAAIYAALTRAERDDVPLPDALVTDPDVSTVRLVTALSPLLTTPARSLPKLTAAPAEPVTSTPESPPLPPSLAPPPLTPAASARPPPILRTAGIPPPQSRTVTPAPPPLEQPRSESPSSSGAWAKIDPPALPVSPPPLPPPARISRTMPSVKTRAPEDPEDGPIEISAVHVMEAIDPEGRLTTEDRDPPAAPVVEVADDAVLEAEDVPSTETIPSNLDPWFAQLVHGYCPPEGAQFARPTPPTNFPGRDGPPPETVPSFPTRCGGG